MASEPLASVIVAIDRVWEVVLLGSKENTEIIQLLGSAKRCLQMQPPKVVAARDYLVEAKKKLASQGDHDSAEQLGSLQHRLSMRLG